MGDETRLVRDAMSIMRVHDVRQLRYLALFSCLLALMCRLDSEADWKISEGYNPNPLARSTPETSTMMYDFFQYPATALIGE